MASAGVYGWQPQPVQRPLPPGLPGVKDRVSSSPQHGKPHAAALPNNKDKRLDGTPLLTRESTAFLAPDCSAKELDSTQAQRNRPHVQAAQSQFSPQDSTPAPSLNPTSPNANAPESLRYLLTNDPPANLTLSDQASEYFYSPDCTYGSNITGPTFWFRNEAVPEFLVCSYCFETQLRRTVFGAMFSGKCEEFPGGGKCHFSSSFVQNHVFPTALRENSFESLKAYMERRVKIPDCRGMGGVTGQDASRLGIRWYKPDSNALEGFVVCEACCQDFICGGTFQSRFFPHPGVQQANDTWACDVAIPYVKRMASELANSLEWETFTLRAAHRLTVPTCGGVSQVKAGSRKWFRPRGANEHVVICEQCFLDTAASTSFETEYMPIVVPPEGVEADCMCDYWSIPIQASYDVAKFKHDFSIFLDTLNIQVSSPLCTSKGTTGGKWYTLRGGCPNFDICQTCYQGLIVSLQLEEFFQPRVSPSQAPGSEPTLLICDFAPGTARFGIYLSTFAKAIPTPKFEQIFSTFIRRIAPLPSCTKLTWSANRTWHIYAAAGLNACEECYQLSIHNTGPLSTLWIRTPTALTAEKMCMMYSTNMRTRWHTLCQTATTTSPHTLEQVTSDFIAYANHRTQVYTQTVPIIENIRNQTMITAMRQQTLNSASSFYNFLDKVSAPSMQISYGPGGVTDPYVYGNTQLGYYETQWGVEGARLGREAQAMAYGGGGDLVRVGMLERAWREVE